MASEENVKLKFTSEANTAGFEKVKRELSGMQKTLLSVRSTIGGVMKAFGVFGMAVQGIQATIKAIRAVAEWFNGTGAEAKAAADKIKKDFAAAVDSAATAQGRLNKSLQESLALIKENAAAQEKATAAARKYEDTLLEIDRARALQGVTDPEKAAAINKSFDERAAALQSARAAGDADRAGRPGYDSALAYEQHTADIEKQIEKTKKLLEQAIKNRIDAYSAAAREERGGFWGGDWIPRTPQSRRDRDHEIAAKAKESEGYKTALAEQEKLEKTLNDLSAALDETRKKAAALKQSALDESAAAIKQNEAEKALASQQAANAETAAALADEEREIAEWRKKTAESRDMLEAFQDEAESRARTEKEKQEEAQKSFDSAVAGIDWGYARTSNRLTAMGLAGNGGELKKLNENTASIKTAVERIAGRNPATATFSN